MADLSGWNGLLYAVAVYIGVTVATKLMLARLHQYKEITEAAIEQRRRLLKKKRKKSRSAEQAQPA